MTSPVNEYLLSAYYVPGLGTRVMAVSSIVPTWAV